MVLEHVERRIDKMVKNKSREKSIKAKKMNGNYWERYESFSWDVEI